MTIDPQLLETIVEDLEAERAYADMLADPETVVDAFDLFDSTGPDLCARWCGRVANSIMHDDLCNECRNAETLARHAALKAAHPESFSTFRGRDRRRWTN